MGFAVPRLSRRLSGGREGNGERLENLCFPSRLGTPPPLLPLFPASRWTHLFISTAQSSGFLFVRLFVLNVGQRAGLISIIIIIIIISEIIGEARGC